MLKRVLMVAAGAAMLLAPVGIAMAQDAKAVYEKRVATMKSNGASAGAISRFLRGEAEFGPAVVTAAETLDANAKVYPALFVPGSVVEGSRAKPEIWSNAADFNAKLTAFQTATANLASVVKSGDKAQIGPALQAVGASCGGCHQGYQAAK